MKIRAIEGRDAETAVQYAIGGNFDAFGTIEAEMLKFFGLASEPRKNTRPKRRAMAIRAGRSVSVSGHGQRSRHGLLLFGVHAPFARIDFSLFRSSKARAQAGRENRFWLPGVPHGIALAGLRLDRARRAPQAAISSTCSSNETRFWRGRECSG